MSCKICGKSSELHHWKTVGSGGKDETWNLIPLCREHHTEVHKIGTITFAKKHPRVQQWLKTNGWTLFNYKWIRFTSKDTVNPT